MQDKAKKQDSTTQVFNSVCGFFCLIEHQENILQAYRQTLTTRIDFHPLALFQYISRGQNSISRRHIMLLLEQNGMFRGEDELKIMFGIYGYKQKIDFVGFLNYIYPSSTQPLKYISTVGLKKYSGMEICDGINQQIVCLTILLFAKEIEFVQEMENFKQENFSKLNKNQIKKLIKTIKRKTQSKNLFEVQSQNVITFSQIRNCLRKIKNMNDNKINSVCRRLSMSKDNFVSLQQLQFWLKSWNRVKNEEIAQSKPLNEDLQMIMI